MVDVATLALEARTDGLLKAEAALDQVTRAAVRTETATEGVTAAANQQSAAMGRASVAARGMGGGFQNLGYQVQDFATQVGAGTSATQALGQQLPQLLSGFGGIGIAIGTASAVLIPLIGYFVSGASGAKDFAATLEDLETQLSDAGDLAAIAAGDFETLIERFGALTPAVQALVGVQAEITLRSMADAANALNAELTAMYDGNAWLNVSRAEDLSNGLNLGTAAAREMAAAMTELSRADTLDQQLALVTSMRERFVETVGPIGQMTSAQFQFYQRLVDSESALRATKARADELANAGAKVAQAISVIPPILNSARDAANSAAGAVAGIGNAAAGAVGQVRGLAQAMWDAAQARISASKWVDSMQPGGTGDLAAQYAQYGAGRRAAEQATQKTVEFSGAVPFVAGAGGGGGGGGGGGDDGFQSRLDALMEGLQTERDTVDQWYAESMEILNDRRAQELLGAQGHADAVFAIEEELNKRKAALRADDLGNYSSFFGSLATIASIGGQKMAKAVAAAQAIEGTINAYGAAIKALNTPGITLAGRFAAYASVLAAGLKGVSAIKSAGGGGGGAAGGGGGSVGAVPVAPVATPSRSLRINVEGEGIFADQLRRSMRVISEALGEERDIGGFVVA